MIYFLHGSDYKKAREKLNNLLDSLFTKKPDAAFFKVANDNFNEAQLDEFVLGQGLFEQKYIILLDGLLEDKKTQQIILDKVKEISSSPNIFIIIEGILDKKTFSKIEKVADKVQVFGSTEKKKEDTRNFNIFSLTDSFSQRDKKKTWVLFQKALMSGVLPEEIHNILIWQIKNLLLVKSASNAKEVSLNPFVFKKSNAFANNFEDRELKKISAKLVSLHSLNRKGKGELEFELEKLVLGV